MKNKSRLAVLLLSLLTLPIITALFMGCPGEGMEVKAPRVKREVADLKGAEGDNIIPSNVVAEIIKNLVGYSGRKINHVHVAEVVNTEGGTNYHVLVMKKGRHIPYYQMVKGVYYVLGADKRVIRESTKFASELINDGGVPYLNTHFESKNDKNSDSMKLEVVDNGVTLKRESESAFVKSTDAEIISVLMTSVESMMEQVDGDLRVDDTEYNKFAGVFFMQEVSGGATVSARLEITIKTSQKTEIEIEHFSNEKKYKTTKLSGTRILEYGRTKIVAKHDNTTDFTFELAGDNIRVTIGGRYGQPTPVLYIRQK